MKALFVFLLISSAFAAQNVPLSRYRVNPSDVVMKQVADQFEVERRQRQGFDILVPQNKVQVLKKLVPNAVLLKKDISIALDSLLANGYRELPEVMATLRDMAAKYPRLVQLLPYGTSGSGRELMAVKFSDNVKSFEGEPQLMITAATHGDELITVEVLLTIMQQLLDNYASDPRVAKIINSKEIYFIPVVNPDGFAKQQRYEHGQDPNRSYPYPENMNVKPTTSIAALIKFFNSKNIKGSLDLHAFGEMIMYPWGYTRKTIEAQDEQKLYDLTRRMSETNNYAYGPISKVIYVAKGSSADYYYMSKKTAAIAIEIGQAKVPPARKIPEQVEEIQEPIMKFLENF